MGIIDDPNDLDDFERRQRFDEIAAEFGRSIAAWECAPWVHPLDLLARDGVECPDADALAGWSDDAVTTLLWRVIEHLARQNTHLRHTDHLSDRALYLELLDGALQEPTKDWAAVLSPDEIAVPGSWSSSIDMSGEWETDESVRVYAMYYVADDDVKERAMLADLLQDRATPLPAFRPPPYDRDRFLPRHPEERRDETPQDDWFDEGDTRPRGTDPDPRRRDDHDGPFLDNDIPF